MKQPKTNRNGEKTPSRGGGAPVGARSASRSAPIAPRTDDGHTPEGLKPATAAWFAEVREEYALDDPAGLYLLETAARSWDRAQEARKAIEKDGLRVKDRFKQWKAHPLCTVERDALATFRASLKDLNLDLEPLRDRPGRPPGT